jgi:hypothetical protein
MSTGIFRYVILKLSLSIGLGIIDGTRAKADTSQDFAKESDAVLTIWDLL